MNNPDSCKPTCCPKMEQALQLLSKKWAGLIVYSLLSGPKRYKEIADFLPNISDRMLSERFRDLEEAGIVARHVYPEVPVRIEYELTAKGKALEPILRELQQWADEWAQGTPEST
jgi:DNA-binding HxlR family transcriptional regulator